MRTFKNYFKTLFQNQFVLGFLILGAALLFISVRPIYHYYYGDYSIPVLATVVNTREIKNTNSGGQTYRSFVINYTYEYDGKSYLSNRYRYSHDTPRDVLQYKPGDTLQAFVNPEHPSQAVIVNEYTWTNIIGCILGLSLVVGSFIIHGRILSHSPF